MLQIDADIRFRLVITASFCLFLGHPGFIFGRNEAKAHSLPMYEEHDNSDSKV